MTLPAADLLLPGRAHAAPAPAGAGDGNVVIAWNDLGMHCIDPDFSVFSILPPYNTINAQVIQDGQLVTDAGTRAALYSSVADGTGSINTTSVGKTNFWDHVQALFGVSLPVDTGLTGSTMPGAQNVPQPMHFDGVWDWMQGEGIPVTPIDDAGAKQPYPLMRVDVTDAAGGPLASTVTSVPNSQELLCSACHASGTSPHARPRAGWGYHPDPLKDDRFNILRLHDERNLGQPAYDAALGAAGYRASGLFDTVVLDGTSILCARCHGSNALPGTGMAGIRPLTVAMHGGHAAVTREDGLALDDVVTRDGCYTCHPGLDTQCLRGAMGTAVGDDGDYAMHCQSCHGGMSDVGDPARVGWLEQATCQNCHTGTATDNSGEIRFDSVFDAMGHPHVAASDVFATTEDVPASGFSLYRFSMGHGELQCAACHGPPHAIYPTSVENDNVQNTLLQGHDGTLMECNVCHTTLEDDKLHRGPHGMHATSEKWVRDVHKDRAEHHLSECMECHGADSRGTVLSLAQADRTYPTPWGLKTFFEGQRISCYTCHDGPDEDDPPSNQAPSVADRQLSTPLDVPLSIQLTGADPENDALEFRIVSQPSSGAFGRPSRGTVGIAGSIATFLPGEEQGDVTFTYAANDGLVDSNLGEITVTVLPPICPGEVETVGFGCGGATGGVPTLTVTGCPEPGGTLQFELTDAKPGAAAIFAQGTGIDVRELSPGCVYRVKGTTSLTPFVVSQAGTFSFPVTVPASATGSLTFQVFVRDPGPNTVGAFTRAIRVVLP